MTTTACPCGKPAPETAYLCASCVNDLWVALGDVPALVTELTITLAKQRRWEYDTHGSRSAVVALPYNLAAARSLQQLHRQLTDLARRCVLTDVPATHHRPRGTSSVQLSHWLMCRIAGIAAQPWAGEALGLVYTVERAMLVIDRPAEHTYAGPCEKCGHDLYAQAAKAFVTCHDCGLTYDLAERRYWLLQQVDDQLATATDISRALTSMALPVTAERIRQWKHRDRIQVRAHDRADRPLYRVGDVVELLVEYAEHVGA